MPFTLKETLMKINRRGDLGSLDQHSQEQSKQDVILCYAKRRETPSDFDGDPLIFIRGTRSCEVSCIMGS